MLESSAPSAYIQHFKELTPSWRRVSFRALIKEGSFGDGGCIGERQGEGAGGEVILCQDFGGR